MMQPKPKLNLTWIEKENRPRPEPRIRIVLEEPSERQDPVISCYEAVLDVCGNPRCGCLNIRLQFQPAPENADVPSFAPSGDCWLDLNQKALVLTAGQARHYIERTQSQMQSLAAAPPRKIGRNEP